MPQWTEHHQERIKSELMNIKADYHRIVNNLFSMRDELQNLIDQADQDREGIQEQLDNFSTTGPTPQHLEELKRVYTGRMEGLHSALTLLNAVDFANYREKDEKDQKSAA